MTHEFKPGDRVRCIETWTTYVIDSGDEFTVEDVRGTVSGVEQVLVDGQWVPARYFEKVIAPEFVVGQKVSGTDYERLPVGSKAEQITKTSAEGWTNELGDCEQPSGEWYSERTLTHLGDGTYTEPAAEPEDAEEPTSRIERLLHFKAETDGLAACGQLLAAIDNDAAYPVHIGHSRSSFIGWLAGGGRDLSPTTGACTDCVALAQQPEDAEDAYVEAEPPKEGDWVQVWAQVSRLRSDGDTVCRFFFGPMGFYDERVRDDAIVRPEAGHVPPWIKPAQCTSLKEHDGVLVRCTGTPVERCEKHGAPFSPSVLTWTDAEESGRITEGGAS